MWRRGCAASIHGDCLHFRRASWIRHRLLHTSGNHRFQCGPSLALSPSPHGHWQGQAQEEESKAGRPWRPEDGQCVRACAVARPLRGGDRPLHARFLVDPPETPALQTKPRSASRKRSGVRRACWTATRTMWTPSWLPWLWKTSGALRWVRHDRPATRASSRGSRRPRERQLLIPAGNRGDGHTRPEPPRQRIAGGPQLRGGPLGQARAHHLRRRVLRRR